MNIKKKSAMALFIAFIMIFSIFGLFLDSINFSSQQKITYNNYKFTQTEKGWMTNYQGQELYFFLSPQMIEQNKINKEAIEKLNQAQKIQITYDANSTNRELFAELQYMLENTLTNILKKEINIGLFNANITNIITCESATQENPVILLEEGNNEIIYENNCLRLKSSEDIESLKQTEVIIYQMLGIIQ